MARPRNPNRDKALEIFKEHNGDISNREIANILGEDEKIIAVWKGRDKWKSKVGESNVVQQMNESCTTKEKRAKKKPKKAPERMPSDIDREIVDKVMENGDLTDKQRLFCINYIKCFNATKAYQKAYGCDYITANTNGPRLLVNACIKNELERLRQSKLNRAYITEDDIFQKMMDIAFSDITDYTEFGAKDVLVISKVTGEQLKDENGEPITYKSNYVHFKNSGEIDGSLITEVSQGKDGVKVKLADRMRALQWLSDRMDLLSTVDRERLRMAQEKLDHERNSDTVGEINVNIVSRE